MIGFEPTTFTLATCKPTEAKSCDDNALQSSEEAARSACAARTEHSTGKTYRDRTEPNADLDAVVQSWPTLPEAVRAGIVAMVKAARRA